MMMTVANNMTHNNDPKIQYITHEILFKNVQEKAKLWLQAKLLRMRVTLLT